MRERNLRGLMRWRTRKSEVTQKSGVWYAQCQAEPSQYTNTHANQNHPSDFQMVVWCIPGRCIQSRLTFIPKCHVTADRLVIIRGSFLPQKSPSLHDVPQGLTKTHGSALREREVFTRDASKKALASQQNSMFSTPPQSSPLQMTALELFEFSRPTAQIICKHCG